MNTRHRHQPDDSNDKSTKQGMDPSMKPMDVSPSWRRASRLGTACNLKCGGLDSPLFAVPAWTAAHHGATHVLAGGRNIAQVTENAKAGELNLEAADVARIRKDVIALGEPVKG